jgi:uncharacterized iron-regulated membrane protein
MSHPAATRLWAGCGIFTHHYTHPAEHGFKGSHMAQQSDLYNTVWRWHFYAGLIITPILLVMAVTGGIYLFEPELEDALYGDVFYNKDTQATVVDHAAIVAAVQQSHPQAHITSYRPPQQAGHNARLVIDAADGRELLVLVDPANLSIAGEIDSKARLTQISKRIHGGLMAGTTGEVIVELVACWTIIMVITGIYLWWPRVSGVWGTLLPRLRAHRRIFWRDLHAVPGFFLSLWILVIIGTGLPWSAVWGNLLDKFAIGIGEEFPQEVFGNRPQSIATAGAASLDVNAVISIAQQQGLSNGFEIQYPWGENGTFAAVPLRHSETADNTAYLFIDRYSGEIRKDIRWDDIGAVGKLTSLGVRLHEGRLFGNTNQFMNLTAVIVLIGMTITGFTMWLQRKPKGALGAPKTPAAQIEKKIILTIIILGIVLPLAGASMLLFWLWDRIQTQVSARPSRR